VTTSEESENPKKPRREKRHSGPAAKQQLGGRPQTKSNTPPPGKLEQGKKLSCGIL